jgi:hypothetical protein
VRSSEETYLRSAPTPITSRMARLANRTRPAVSTSIKGSGSRSRTSRASGDKTGRADSPLTTVLFAAGRMRPATTPATIAAVTSAGNTTHMPAAPSQANTPAPTSEPATAAHKVRRKPIQNADSLAMSRGPVPIRIGHLMRDLMPVCDSRISHAASIR